MKPSQTLYILRRLRASCADGGDDQSAEALDIAAQAVEIAQNKERALRNGSVLVEPVSRSKGPRIEGARSPGGVASLITEKRWRS